MNAYYVGQGTQSEWFTLRFENDPTATDAEAWKLWGPFPEQEQADHMANTLNELEQTYARNPNYL